MSNSQTQSKLQYENNWLRFYEIVEKEKLLLKENKATNTTWQREDELAKLFDHIAILSPIDTTATNARKYILPAGQPLIQVIEEGKTILEERMKIAEQLIRIVSSFHSKELFFCDLTWHLFWYDLLEERLYLLDTSMTSDLSNASKHHRIADIEPDMYCIAPEQVVSSSYVADFRSNFYALGVMLYALFTTKKPFEGIERLLLLHKHKVDSPLSPIEHEINLGHDLSNFILKLLAKTPEERYQSNQGLNWDFRQLRENFRKGNTEVDFKLGTHDFASHFSIPNHLFFRKEEHKVLIKQAKQAALGQKSLLLIKGQKGVGIAKAMDNFLDTLNPLSYYFAKGAYSAESNFPYSDIRTLTSDLLHQILRQDHSTLKQIKESLNENIGNLSGVLIDFNEGFEAFFSSNQAYQELTGAAALNRLTYAYLEFLSILEEQGKTIVLCIDQMHLSNYNSLNLVERLLTSSKLKKLLIVIGFDENQMIWSQYFTQFHQSIETTFPSKQTVVKEKQILNFSKGDLGEILKKLKIEPLEELNDFLYQKTNGNAEFVKQLLGEISSKNLIYLASNQQAWQVHIPSIKDIDLSDNINESLSKKIQNIQKEELSLLKAAAIIGQQFKVSQLKAITQWDTQKILTAIDNLRAGDFIIPSTYKQAKLYELRFAHSSFLELIKKIISPKEYEAIKLQLAKDILNHIDINKDDHRLYELMSHLLAIPAKACEPYKKWILEAALKAKKETAFEFAQKYFEKLVEISELDSSDKSIIFEYAYESCSCTLFARNYEHYEKLLNELSNYAANKLQLYQIFVLKSTAYMEQQRFQEAITNMTLGLNEMGVSFSETITQRDQIIIFMLNMWRIRNIDPTNIERYPFNKDEKIHIYHNLLNISSAAVFFLNPPLTSRITRIKVANLIKEGLHSSSPVDLISVGFVMNNFSNLVEKADKIARAGLKLLEQKIKDDNSDLLAHFMYGVFIQHAKYPLSKTIELLKNYYKRGQEMGNIHTAFYCLGMNRWYMFFNGVQLGVLSEVLSASHRLAIDNKQTTIDNYHKIIISIIAELRNENFNAPSFSDSTLAFHEIDTHKADYTTKSSIRLAKMIIEVASGRIIKDVEIVRAALSYIDSSGRGTYNAIVIIFYLFYQIFKTNYYDKEITKSTIKKNLKILEVRTKSAPSNHAAKFFLLKALYAIKQLKNTLASSYFQKAYHAALEYDNNWDIGMVCEEYAHFLIAQGKERVGKKLIQEAAEAYGNWGALRITSRLYKTHPNLKKVEKIQLNAINATSKNNTALHQIFQGGQKILGEESLDTQIKLFLEIVEELTNAKKTLFLIDMENNLRIAGKKQNGRPALIADENANKEQLPLSLIRVVIRRKESIILEDTATNEQFINDAYIKSQKPQTIFCIPFVKNDIIKNLLYVEPNWNGIRSIHQQIRLVDMLYKQVASTLDHSILTEKLEEKLALRSRQIKLERDKSDELLTNILPKKIAIELKTKGSVKPRKYDHVSVLFTDFKDFSKYSSSLSPDQLIGGLNECYKAFDRILTEHRIEKIKTIGDAYMCAAGIPEALDHHELDIIKAGLEIIAFIKEFNIKREEVGLPAMPIRAGIHTGPVIAGVVGIKKYAYDIWGSTVNIASRMESHSEAGRLNISGSTYLKIKNYYNCEYRGKINAKNIGEIDMYFVGEIIK